MDRESGHFSVRKDLVKEHLARRSTSNQDRRFHSLQMFLQRIAILKGLSTATGDRSISVKDRGKMKHGSYSNSPVK